jgi:hypothetical protein
MGAAMPLQATVETLDDVEEAHRDLYKEVSIKGPDGKTKKVFQVDLAGADQLSEFAPLKNAHERQKTENASLKEKVAELEAREAMPDGITVEEITRLQAVDKAAKDGDDPDKKKAHEAEVQSIKTMHEQALQRIKDKAVKDLAEATAAHEATKIALRQRVVRDDLTKALLENGVDKKYLKGARALLEQSIKVKGDGGDMKAYVETDLGETDIGEFVPQWAQSEEGKLYVSKATGSDATGADNKGKGGGSLDANPWTKANWNSTVQAQVWKGDAAKADRLAKAAGHKQALGARAEDAK